MPDHVERVRAFDEGGHPGRQRGAEEGEDHGATADIDEQNLHGEERTRKRGVVDTGKTGPGGHGDDCAHVGRIQPQHACASLREHGTEFARRHLSAHRQTGADDEDLQQHMGNGLPDRHESACHRLFDRRDRLRFRAQGPPCDGGDRCAAEHRCRTPPCRRQKGAGQFRMLHEAQAQVFDGIEQQCEQPRADAYECTEHQCGDEQRESAGDHRRSAFTGGIGTCVRHRREIVVEMSPAFRAWGLGEGGKRRILFTRSGHIGGAPKTFGYGKTPAEGRGLEGK